MIGIRRHEDRARYEHEKSRHFYSFSFGEYQDPEHRGYGPLKVLNEDQLEPGAGFPEHPHDEIELITFVVRGELRYKDDQGTSLILESGDVQRATCGTGIRHSVYNNSQEQELVVLQCWIDPNQPGLPPSVDHWEAPDEARRNQWAVVASGSGQPGAMHIHRDCEVYTGRLSPGRSLEFEIPAGRHVWVQVLRGSLEANGIPVRGGDGLAVHDERAVHFQAAADSELLLFDLG